MSTSNKGLDLEFVRNRLKQFKEASNKSKDTWKPENGEQVIRIVPRKLTPRNPFVELFFHYELAKRPYLSLKTFGEPDPVVLFCDSLRRTGDKENWFRARKLEPKARTYVPIIVRGKEAEGVKWWAFGKRVYETLLTTVNIPQWGDITDVHTGRDVLVNFTPKDKTKKDSFPVTTVTVMPDRTPLTEDPELLKTLLDNQKDIFDVFPKPTFEELEKVLRDFFEAPQDAVSTEGGEGDDEHTEPDSEATGDEPVVTGTAKVGTPSVGGTVSEDVTKTFEDLLNRAKK